METEQKTEIKNRCTSIPRRRYAGIHLIAEFWGGKIIEDSAVIERLLMEAARHARSSPIKASSHKFSPHGITAFVLLAESHLSVHSWPEISYLAIDIFTCGDFTMPHKALDYLKQVYKPERVEMREIKRGKLR